MLYGICLIVKGLLVEGEIIVPRKKVWQNGREGICGI